METKYNINKNELTINFNFFNDIYDNQNRIKSIRNYINNLIINNNIKFNGNKIIIYKNGILIGTFYLINYYLNKLKISKYSNYLTSKNSYFCENNYIEINNSMIKTKKLILI